MYPISPDNPPFVGSIFDNRVLDSVRQIFYPPEQVYRMDVLIPIFEKNVVPKQLFVRVDDYVEENNTKSNCFLYVDIWEKHLLLKTLDPIENNWDILIDDLTDSEIDYIINVYAKRISVINT